MQTSGQITFADPKKIRNNLPQIKSALNHNHSPPVKNGSASYFGSILGYLLDKSQVSEANSSIKNPKVVQEVAIEAKKEVLKDTLKKKEENANKLDQLVKTANKTLLTISTVFPFTLFPTVVSIDPDKVTINFTEFFASHNYQTILIKEISHVAVQTDLFFGSLKITDSVMRGHVVLIKFLKKKEAEEAGKIIRGLIVGTKQQVDLTQFEPKELTKKVEELGQSAPPS